MLQQVVEAIIKLLSEITKGSSTATQAAGGSPESLMPIWPAVRPARMAPYV